jgi:DNA replication protein DnaC
MKSIGDVVGSMRPVKPRGDHQPVTEPLPCPICGGAGYLRIDVPVGDPRFGEMVACECTVKELAAKRMQAIIAGSNLGPLRGKTLDNFTVQPGRDRRPARSTPEAARNAAVAFAERPDRSENERVDAPRTEWLILGGTHGTGKTHLAAAIANARIEAGREAVFIVVPDLLDRLRAAYSPNSEVTYDELFESARAAELLVLDDLGAQSSTAWAQEKLYQILNERYNRRLPTVITSNLRLDDMELRLRSRIGDVNMADNYWIQAPDIRLGIEHDESKATPQRARPRAGR